MFIPQAYAQNCDPGAETGVDLGKCYSLGLGKQGTVGETYGDIASLVNVIIGNVYIFAGMIIFFMFLYAGFKFIQDTAKGKDEARSIVSSALIGLVVLFSAFWIIEIIAVVTGANIGFLVNP